MVLSPETSAPGLPEHWYHLSACLWFLGDSGRWTFGGSKQTFQTRETLETRGDRRKKQWKVNGKVWNQRKIYKNNDGKWAHGRCTEVKARFSWWQRTKMCQDGSRFAWMQDFWSARCFCTQGDLQGTVRNSVALSEVRPMHELPHQKPSILNVISSQDTNRMNAGWYWFHEGWSFS